MTSTEPASSDGEGLVSPDYIIDSLGGCGRFQLRMTVIIHLMKTIICFTFIGMVVLSATPDWWCQDDVINGACTVYENETEINKCQSKSCVNGNKTTCQNFGYDNEINTIVSEFNLVCKQDYIPSLINSLQIAGTLFGNLLAGQVADLFGRKPPLFFSMFLLMLSNLLGYFSINWEMMAVFRFFAGMGGGFFMTIQYCLMSEFSLARWRVWIIGFPSWQFQASLFSLLAWLLHDWRYIQLLTALMTLPFFLAWWVIPESFRWYIAHDKVKKAEAIVRSVAEFNRRTEYDVDAALHKPEVRKGRRYTILHLFRTKEMLKVTFLLSLSWISLGLVSYGIAFGIPTLSGNLFFNIFLFNLTGIPCKGVALWFQNRIGRRSTSIICFIVVVVSGAIVGTVQVLDTLYKDKLTNAFALIAYLGISSAWGPIQTMTVEIYPTVIRNIGFGTLSVTARTGAIIGPQLVYLDKYLPGVLYFVCAGISVICIIGLIFLPETMDKHLNDKIKKKLHFESNIQKTDTDGKSTVNKNSSVDNSSVKSSSMKRTSVENSSVENSSMKNGSNVNDRDESLILDVTSLQNKDIQLTNKGKEETNGVMTHL